MLIDPRTSTPEACSNCTSKESPVGLWTGSTAILFGVVAVILLLALCYYLLFTGE